MFGIIIISVVFIFIVGFYWNLNKDNKGIIYNATKNSVGFILVGSMSQAKAAVKGSWKLGSAVSQDIENTSQESIDWLDKEVNHKVAVKGGVIRAAAKTAKEHRDTLGLTDLGTSIDKYYAKVHKEAKAA